MAKSKAQGQGTVTVKKTIKCPYCQKNTSVVPAEDYRPIFVDCTVCGKRFIAQRTREDIEALKIESASVLENPDLREIELSQGDEE
jgi:transcription elongation factor Elf1